MTIRMDLRSIINSDGNAVKDEGSKDNSSASSSTIHQQPLGPPPAPLRRASSIADLVDPPGTPPPIPSPTSLSGAAGVLSSSSQPMLRAALSPRVSPRASPTLISHAIGSVTSSPTMMSNSLAGPGITAPGLGSRSRSMSITSITTADEGASRRNSVSSTGTANGSRAGDDHYTDTIRSSPEMAKSESRETQGRSKPNGNELHNREVKTPQKSPENKRSNSRRKKYDTPPIYARKWCSDWRIRYGIDNSSGLNGVKEEPTIQVAAEDPFGSQDQNRDTQNPDIERYGTFTNLVPYEDLTRRVASWIYANVVEMPPEMQSQIEIEAKIGLINSKQTRQRLVLPVDTETLLNTDMLAGSIEFESDIGKLQFQSYVNFLNECVDKSEKWKTPIATSHSKTKDTFYPLQTPSGSLNGPQKKSERLRITTDTITNRVTAKIVKTRVRDLMIFCPGSKFDIRISLNIERPEQSDPPSNSRPNNERVKDRLSYIYRNSRVDLTKVNSDDRQTHELELELDIIDTIKHIEKIKARIQDDEYEEGIKSYLDNVRLLVRRGGLDLKVP
ncbi:CYTH-like domain-containing protein [Dipodascopsis uninucleata]